jgi:hypothetical protein
VWLEAVFEQLTARRARRPVLVVYKGLASEVREHPSVVAWCAANPRRALQVTHYGAVRGSNRFRRCDAVVTLCDPWLNGDDILGRAEWLGLDEPSYRIALATAELGQAQGRSRSVRRRRRLTHVHVGRLVPDGWGAGVVVEPLGGPPERSRGAGERVEFGALVGVLGGNRAAAEALGYSASAVAGWKGGSRGLPREVLERARVLGATRHKPTVSSGEGGRGALAAEMDAPPCIKNTRGCVHGTAATPPSPADESVSGGLQGEVSVLEPLSPRETLSLVKTKIPPSARVRDVREGEGGGGLVPEEVTPFSDGRGGEGTRKSSLSSGEARVTASASLSLQERASALSGDGEARARVSCLTRLSGAGIAFLRGAALPRFEVTPEEVPPLLPAEGRGRAAFNAVSAARVLALLEQMEPSPLAAASARASPRTFDRELALLAEVQAKVRRRLKLGS